MSNRDTSAIIDGVIRVFVVGGVVGAAMVAPNIIQALDKPTTKLLKHLDKRSADRELRRIINYMTSQGLIRGDYEHGLQITPKAKQRLRQVRPHRFSVVKPDSWDKSWRLVMYDIPEKYKSSRNVIAKELRQAGFWQLQRSVWIFPHECRAEVEALALHLGVDKFVTYMKVEHIDNQKALIEKFKIKNLL